MKRDKDLIGQKFERWTVLSRAPDRYDKRGYPRRYWNCKCECGTEKEIAETMLKCGNSKSCGCLHKEIVKEINKSKKKYNKYDLTSQPHGICYASNTNQKILFDKDDYDLIKDYCWRIDSHGYVVTSMKNKSTGKYNNIVKMHRFLVSCPDGFVIDHKDTNKLNNQKNNLRICLQSDNTKNHKISKNNTSGVVGVRWNKNNHNWRVFIGNKNVGSFDNFEDAVKARKEAEEKYFGEFSYDNSMRVG